MVNTPVEKRLEYLDLVWVGYAGGQFVKFDITNVLEGIAIPFELVSEDVV